MERGGAASLTRDDRIQLSAALSGRSPCGPRVRWQEIPIVDKKSKGLGPGERKGIPVSGFRRKVEMNSGIGTNIWYGFSCGEACGASGGLGRTWTGAGGAPSGSGSWFWGCELNVRIRVRVSNGNGNGKARRCKALGTTRQHAAGHAHTPTRVFFSLLS